MSFIHLYSFTIFCLNTRGHGSIFLQNNRWAGESLTGGTVAELEVARVSDGQLIEQGDQKAEGQQTGERLSNINSVSRILKGVGDELEWITSG